MLEWLQEVLADWADPASGIEHERNHHRGAWWMRSDVKVG